MDTQTLPIGTGTPTGTTTISGSGAFSSFKSAKDHALEAAGELRQAAGDKVVELKEVANAKAQLLASSAREQVSELENYVRANPAKSILVSLGAGMIIGMIFRR